MTFELIKFYKSTKMSKYAHVDQVLKKRRRLEVYNILRTRIVPIKGLVCI